MEISEGLKFRVAGISLKSGKKESLSICVFDYFSGSDRWFLKELKQITGEAAELEDELIEQLREFNPDSLIVDIPIVMPLCHSCTLNCPGLKNCPVSETRTISTIISDLLENDQKLHLTHPKNYERGRVDMELFDYARNLFAKETIEPLLSRTFKRKLRKGFIPYKHRPVDFWVWCRYHDLFLEVFKTSYESIGQISQVGQQRFFYLQRHLPTKTNVYETSPYFLCLELFRKKLVAKYDLEKLSDLDFVTNARNKVLEAVIDTFDLFIYDHDWETLLKDARSFDAFLLAATGITKHLKQTENAPDWCGKSGECFLIPGLV